MIQRIDRTGKVYGYWTVLGFAEPNKHGQTMLRCRCRCGRKAIVNGGTVVNGTSFSCGCYKMKVVTKHGAWCNLKLRPTYESWRKLISRSTNKKCDAFYKYGGVGIRVCKRWLKWKHFFADMGIRPPGTSIDRYPDPYGNYTKSNCRWATRKQQANNCRKRGFLLKRMEANPE